MTRLPAAVHQDILATFDELHAELVLVKQRLASVVFGQDPVIEQVLIAILAGGHALLVGPPGVAKTRLANNCATALGLESKRVQFTPDLMPADILGAEILDIAADGTRNFRFIEGPVFTQLLMADEINRASPRTQAALLQAMQEKFVTIAGQKRALMPPFHVLATQNPIEQEGTYPLPEAQLDRFLLQITVPYPDETAERQMLAATTGTESPDMAPATRSNIVMQAQDMVRCMPIGQKLVDKILHVVRQTRPDAPRIGDKIAWGTGPRASQALSLTMRARALLDGRQAPSEEDLRALALPVMRHRMALTFAARADGFTNTTIIQAALDDVT